MTSDLRAGLDALSKSRPHYDEAHRYFKGRVDEFFSSHRVRRALERTGMKHHLNYAQIPVLAVIDRLELSAITSTDPAAAEMLAQIWKDNRLALEAPNVHRRAGEYGDAYLIVLPVEDDKGEVTGVEMHYNSPLTVRVVYDEADPRKKRFAIKRWCERTSLGEVHRVELFYDGETERWTTKPGVSGLHEADWGHWLAEPQVDGATSEALPAAEDSWLIPNDYGEIPVFHFRNDQPYGVPEHEGAYGCQDAITKLLVTHLNTVDYQAFPQRYGLTDAATTDTGDLDAGDFDAEDFPADLRRDPSDSGDDSSLKSGPGEMWLLRGYKAVGQFQAADPAVFFTPAEFFIRAMAHLTETPLRRFDPVAQLPSGVAQQEADAPFTKKVRNRQLSYGGTWQDAHRFALKLLGMPDAPVDVRWAAASRVNDKDGWTTAGLKSDLGVPNRQLFLEAGYTEDQVQAWLESPTDDGAELARRIEATSVLSETALRLGTAVTLGAIDQGQAQALLEPLIAQLTAKAIGAGG